MIQFQFSLLFGFVDWHFGFGFLSFGGRHSAYCYFWLFLIEYNVYEFFKFFRDFWYSCETVLGFGGFRSLVLGFYFSGRVSPQLFSVKGLYWSFGWFKSDGASGKVFKKFFFG